MLHIKNEFMFVHINSELLVTGNGKEELIIDGKCV